MPISRGNSFRSPRCAASFGLLGCSVALLGAADPVTARVTLAPGLAPSGNHDLAHERDCKNRVIAELSTIDVVVTEADSGEASPPTYAEVLIGTELVTVTIHGQPTDSVTRLPLSRRRGDARALAVRVAELVRGARIRDEARASEHEAAAARPDVVAESSPPPIANADVPRGAPPANASTNAPTDRFSFDAAASALVDPVAASIAAAPSLRASWHVSPSVALRIGALGPSFGTVLERGGTRVTLQQGLARLEAARFGLLGLSWPSFSLGAGAYHVAARGVATSPLEGRTDTTWAALVDLGLGARVPLARAFHFLCEVHTVALFPRPVLDSAGTSTPLGRPLVVGSVGFSASVP